MASYLLHQGATVMCMHSAQARPMMTDRRVKVSGQEIVTQANQYTVTGCTFTIGTVRSPCLTAQWMVAASRIKASNNDVLLQNSTAICTPNGTGVNIVQTQTRVKGT